MQEYRLKKKMTRQELATAVGVSYDMIAKLEKGQRKPSLELAAKIAKRLNTTIQRLFVLPSTLTK